MKVTVIHYRKKTEVASIDLPNDATVDDLKQEIAKATKISKLRQRITYDTQIWSKNRKVLVFGKKISEYTGEKTEVEVTVRDLGPQLPYKALFVLEYLGPVLFLPLGYYISNNYSNWAKFGFALGLLHFVKRELESHFVHIFSNASVPVSGSLKNFFHYWFIYGILVSGEIFFFKTSAGDWPKKYYYIFSAIIVILEFLNLKCHQTLKNLRVGSDGKVDPHKRGIPSGWGFDTVLCANYTYEILVWVTYTIMTKSYMSLLFTLFGATIMVPWALKKKKMLIESFQNDEKSLKMIKRMKFDQNNINLFQ